MLWLLLFLGVLVMVVGSVVVWYKTRGPNAPQDCPQCLGVETYWRTSSQTLASIPTGASRGQAQQVIETFACSNCGHTAAKNRLQTTPSGD